MNKGILCILTGLALCGVDKAGAQQAGAQKVDRTAPYIKVTCSIQAAHITAEPLGAEGGQVLEIDGKPVKLDKGGDYVLSVTKTGYEPYRKTFNADWQGLREKNVTLKRGIGPVEGNIWIADLEDNVEMEFMPIPAGQFQMGSYEGESDERPVRTVNFERSFWMAKTEVNNQQYKQFRSEHPKPYKFEENEVPMPQGAELPASYVSWADAMNYCKWLTRKERRRGRLPEGFEYTLPTEAEWEYACRAGTTGEYAGTLASMAWYVDNSAKRTNPVGQKKPNAWGLHDMHGNVWEWCTDVWYSSYTHAPVNGSQRGDAPDEYAVDRSRIDESGNIHRWYNTNFRVVRGGGWSYPASSCRSANRFYHALKAYDGTGYALNYIGFRPVLVWNPPVPRLKTTNYLPEEQE